ncbi:hypothetical protein HWD13_gp023 [Phage NBSal005]|uniref:Uncharacterized protein n=1 Tax=Phage NBSal005 TaxID=2991865 RepID=A0A6G8QZN6_9CAUD|nr:hypothetical protein HWD13_gp023 [Phage NBSal005]QIN93092.1 hypothetical protein [Phage NBSal005]
MEWVIIGIFVLLILLFVGLRVIDTSVTQAEIKLMQLSNRLSRIETLLEERK